jgi:hypothetical protein
VLQADPVLTCWRFPSFPTVVYDGLVQYYNLTNNDYFYVDVKMSMGVGGLTTFEHQLVDMAPVPVCSAFTANDYNMYGDCPADGRYSFNTKYDFPAPESDFMSWATTGYDGDIILDVYVQSHLIGRCVVGAKTMVTGSYEQRSFKPSGMIAAVVVLSLAALLILYVGCLLVKGCRSRRTAQGKSLPRPQVDREEEAATNYNRMEASADDNSTCPSISAVSIAESRYSATGGPLI